MHPDMVIRQAGVADAGEILTLQRAAYATEAQRYGDPHLPALTQSLTDLEAELADGYAWVATVGSRMVGAVRVTLRGVTAHVGRLVVAPDLHGRGIGTALMQHVHRDPPAGATRFELFTGHLSAGNLRLYKRLGYVECSRSALTPDVELVYLDRSA